MLTNPLMTPATVDKGNDKPVARFYLENAWPTEAAQEWSIVYESIQR